MPFRGDNWFWQDSGRVADHSMAGYFFQIFQLIKST